MQASRRALAEGDRRLAQLIQFGTIQEVDAAAARIRVALGGEAVSAWVPWLAGRAGDARFFSAPSVGEQVVLLSPSGNSAQGIALPGVYSGGGDAPAAADGVTRLEFPDGAAFEVSGGAVSIVAPGGISIIGTVTVQGDVIADGVSLKTHLHGGVTSGSGQSGGPV